MSDNMDGQMGEDTLWQSCASWIIGFLANCKVSSKMF